MVGETHFTAEPTGTEYKNSFLAYLHETSQFVPNIEPDDERMRS